MRVVDSGFGSWVGYMLFCRLRVNGVIFSCKYTPYCESMKRELNVIKEVFYFERRGPILLDQRANRRSSPLKVGLFSHLILLFIFCYEKVPNTMPCKYRNKG